MVALIRHPIADALVRVLPARAAECVAVRIARAAFALRLPALRALEGSLSRLLGDVPRATLREPGA